MKNINPNNNTSGSDSFYWQQLQYNFLSNKSILSLWHNADYKFISAYSNWELHSVFKPTERDMHQNPLNWTWVNNGDIKGFVNDEWFKKHIELMIESNYEWYLNNVFYEYSIKGNHAINKIETNQENKYMSLFEKIIANLERSLFGNNHIQNKVWLKYEADVMNKMNENFKKL